MLKAADYCLLADADSFPTSSPIPASEQGRRLNLLLWALLALTNCADVIGTARAFEIGISELNPIVDLFHADFGMAGVIAPKVLFLTMLYFLLPWVRSWTRALFALACSAYVALTMAHVWYLSPLI